MNFFLKSFLPTFRLLRRVQYTFLWLLIFTMLKGIKGKQHSVKESFYSKAFPPMPQLLRTVQLEVVLYFSLPIDIFDSKTNIFDLC